jgi:hypothetical protein
LRTLRAVIPVRTIRCIPAKIFALMLLYIKIIPLQIGDPPAGFVDPGALGIFPDQPAVIIQGGTDVPAGAIRLQKLAVEPPGFVTPRGVDFPKLIQDRQGRDDPSRIILLSGPVCIPLRG